MSWNGDVIYLFLSIHIKDIKYVNYWVNLFVKFLLIQNSIFRLALVTTNEMLKLNKLGVHELENNYIY
jgi:hypothetical protein